VLALRAVVVLLALSVVPAHAETWSTRDVESAERYRGLERERAERYRAALERAPREEQPEAPRERGGSEARPRPGERLAARLSDWLRARLGAWLGELVAAAEGWLARQLEALADVFGEPPSRREFRRVERAPREPFGDWLAREEERARRLLEGVEAKAAPRLERDAEREWAEREAEREREWARQQARRERGPRPAPWEERWGEAESWERIERERSRQLERAREWWSEERERLEGR
jgi:hypothetical protein